MENHAMGKAVVTILLVQCITIAGYAQAHFFVELSANYSFIPTLKDDEAKIYRVERSWTSDIFYLQHAIAEHYESKPGFDLLFGVSKEILPKLHIETGVAFSRIYFARDVKFRFKGESADPIRITPGDSFEGYDIGGFYFIYDQSVKIDPNNGKTSITYLAIPLKVNYALWKNKLSVGAGLSPAVIIHAIQTKKEMRVSRSIAKIEEVKHHSNDGLNQFLWNGIFTVEYKLFEKLGLKLDYQKSLSPIYTGKQRFAGDAKTSLVRLGLRYYLGKKE